MSGSSPLYDDPALAAAYARVSARNLYNAAYERPAVRALLGGRRGEAPRPAMVLARRGGKRSSMSYGEKPFEEFRVGDAATFSKTISEADILLFAAVSGDHYPLHVDEEYAKTTRFGRRAAHGMLTASLVSTVVGDLLQKPGGIYVEQSLRFVRPVFIGDTLTARAEVTELLPEKRRMRVRAAIVNQRGETVLAGEGVIQKDAR